MFTIGCLYFQIFGLFLVYQTVLLLKDLDLSSKFRIIQTLFEPAPEATQPDKQLAICTLNNTYPLCINVCVVRSPMRKHPSSTADLCLPVDQMIADIYTRPHPSPTVLNTVVFKLIFKIGNLTSLWIENQIFLRCRLKLIYLERNRRSRTGSRCELQDLITNPSSRALDF